MLVWWDLGGLCVCVLGFGLVLLIWFGWFCSLVFCEAFVWVFLFGWGGLFVFFLGGRGGVSLFCLGFFCVCVYI